MVYYPYRRDRRLFYNNFGGIFCLAIVGTCVSITVVAVGLRLLAPIVSSSATWSLIECVCFASLISSTDPVSTLAVFQSLRVDPQLFYLVFGESVLNDAIAITVFRVTSKFVGYDMTLHDVLLCFANFVIMFLTSSFLGYVFGIISALLFRVVDFTHDKLASVAVFVGLVYIPFFLSEMLQLSGIVTILFAGISCRRYVNKNISMDARRYWIRTLSLTSILYDNTYHTLLQTRKLYYLDGHPQERVLPLPTNGFHGR